MCPLIRVRHGLETPAPGRWTIAPGQPVRWATGRWRRQVAAGRTVTGGLLLDDSGPLAVVVSFTGPEPFPALLTYQSFSIQHAATNGRWLIDGEALSAGHALPARSLLIYHGVFRTGDGAVAWLSWFGRLAVTAGGRSRRSNQLRLSAELNLDAPLALLGPGRPASRSAEGIQLKPCREARQ